MAGGTSEAALGRRRWDRRGPTGGDGGRSRAYNGIVAFAVTSPSYANPVVAFDDGRTVYWRTSTVGDPNDIASWSPTAAVGPGTSPRLVSGPSGVFLLIEEGSPGRRHYSVRRFTGSGPDEGTITQDRDGRLHVAWKARAAGAGAALTSRTSPDGIHWTERGIAASGVSRLFHLRIGASPAGLALAVWDGNTDRHAVQAAWLSAPCATGHVGGAGNDTITRIHPLAGDDPNGGVTIWGLAGNDTLRTSLLVPGRDCLFGGEGADTITPGDGADTVDAGPGDDTVNARDGTADVIDCRPGDDTVVADAADRLTGCETVQLPRRSRNRPAEGDAIPSRAPTSRGDLPT